MTRHAEWIGAYLTEAGLHGALIAERQDDRNFGNAETIYQVGGLLLRFLRDRGQDFLDIAPAAEPEQFYHFEDVEAAMNWVAAKANLAPEGPEEISKVIARMSARVPSLESAFDAQNGSATKAKIASVSAVRGAAARRRFWMASRAERNSSK